MKLILATLAALAITASAASAGVNCTRIGNTTYCTETGGGGGSYSCQRIGNTTYCN